MTNFADNLRQIFFFISCNFYRPLSGVVMFMVASVSLSVCLSVCMYVCRSNTISLTVGSLNVYRKFILGLQVIWVKFVYKGHRVKVKVTGATSAKFPISAM